MESTTYETNIPVESIGDEELLAIVQPLAKRAGVTLELRKQYVIFVDDPIFSDLVDNVKEMILRDVPKVKLEGRVIKRRGPRAKVKGEKRLGLHSYRNETTGEVVSKQWINKSLAAYDMPLGTVFTNGKGEQFKVIVDEEGIEGAPFILSKVVAQ